MTRRILIISLIIFILCSYTDAFSNSKLRIISLAPATTEILFALGLNDEIVGVSILCNYPPETKLKEKVGTFSQPSIEKILSLKPDIIFCAGLEQLPIVQKLEQLNLNVYVSDPSNMKELLESIDDIGKLTDKQKQANILIEKMKSVIEEIGLQVKIIPKQKRPKVFVEIWHEPLMTAGKGSFIDELIRLAGGINIAYDTIRPYSYFSPEQAIKRNPDCIILTYMYKQKSTGLIKNRLGWKNISAVKHNRIYNDINPDLILRPGPRLVEGLQEIYKRLHP